MSGRRFIALAAFMALPAGIFLQSTLLAQVLPGGATPNLAFLATLAGGYLWGASGGAVSGMWSGVLLGAAAGSLAAPLACLYGFLGWLAGLHQERDPHAWTYPPVSFCLAVLAVSGGSLISLALEGYQPALSWKLLNIFWCAVLCLPLGHRRLPSREG
jgi:hypothetical protein